MFSFTDSTGTKYQVSFRHETLADEKKWLDSNPNSLYGRTTYCYIQIGEGADRLVVPAHCSRKDNFDKNKGRKAALSRALLTLFPGIENKSYRTMVWLHYFKTLEESSKK